MTLYKGVVLPDGSYTQVPMSAEEEAATLAERAAANSAEAKHAEDMALSCTRTQFMLAALEIGKLDDIEAFVASLDPAEHRETLIRWKESPIFYRNTPAWDAMAPAIGETSESVTALFRLALTK